MGKQKKKPPNRLETLKTIVEILAGIVTIVKAVSDLFRG